SPHTTDPGQDLLGSKPSDRRSNAVNRFKNFPLASEHNGEAFPNKDAGLLTPGI
ncbi:unnamed protein product, partial [Arabidopsis halleri]